LVYAIKLLKFIHIGYSHKHTCAYFLGLIWESKSIK